MLFNYNSKNFISNLNNLFFFYNIRKTKKIKNWFLYLYWSYLLHELSNYKKLHYLLKNKKIKFDSINNTYKSQLYEEFINFNLKLKKYKLKKYYLYRIKLIKATISYFFDFLIKFIRTKKLNEDKFFLLKKLNFWKLDSRKRVFTGFNYRRLLPRKRKKFTKNKLSKIYNSESQTDSKILNIKLNLFSLSTYNLKWHSVLFICGLYKSYYTINNLMDVMRLLDRKVDYFLMNWFNLSSNDIEIYIKNKLIKLNSSYLADNNYIIENGFILTMNHVNNAFLYNLLFIEKRNFFIFLFLNENYNKFPNYLNWFTYLKIKKIYVLNLLKTYKLNHICNLFYKKDKNTVVKFIDFFYKIVNDYTSILKKNIDITINKRSMKFKKFSILKVNFYITVTSLDIQNNKAFYLSSTITNYYIKTINHILTLSAFYYILKKKLANLRALKKNNILKTIIRSLNFKKEITLYFKNYSLNLLLILNLNKLFKNIIHINWNYIVYFIYNNLIKNVSLDINFLHTKYNYFPVDKVNYKNKIFFFKKKKTIRKRKLTNKFSYFKTNSKYSFLNINMKKNYIQFYKYKLISNLLFNYFHTNNIINYKSKILFYNLEKKNSYLNNKSKWLNLFDLNKNLSFSNLKNK